MTNRKKTLKEHQRLATLCGIARGIKQAKRGEERPMRKFLEELAREHNISLK
jgi:hypothetical protein